MHLLHLAKRPMATLAALSLVLAACSDSTAPDAPFDPSGTSADVATATNAFNSPALDSYNAISDEMGTILGGTPSGAVAVMPARALASRQAAAAYAKKFMARYSSRAGARPNFATSSIPAEFVGKTFEYDVETGHYVPTDRTGAPADGVRFILYAVNPFTGVPTEPLTEVGYAQLTATESGTSSSATVKVVSDGVTYLEYGVNLSVTSSTVIIGIEGSATNGTDSAEFAMTVRLTGNESNAVLTVGYALTVPNKDFLIETNISFDMASGSITVDLVARGPHGRVNLAGSATEEGGSYSIRVNGDLFATITVTGTTATILGADGEALNQEEREALQQVFAIFDGGLDFFDSLVTPTGVF